MSDEHSSQQAAGGLLNSAQNFLNLWLRLLHTRIQIVATEFEEERERIKMLVLYGVLALVFISLGLITLTLFVTLWLWELYGVQALGIIGLILLATGIGIALRARHHERCRPRLFATTLAELSKDRQTLRDPHE